MEKGAKMLVCHIRNVIDLGRRFSTLVTMRAMKWTSILEKAKRIKR